RRTPPFSACRRPDAHRSGRSAAAWYRRGRLNRHPAPWRIAPASLRFLRSPIPGRRNLDVLWSYDPAFKIRLYRAPGAVGRSVRLAAAQPGTDAVVGYALERRVLPVRGFTRPQYQQPAGLQALDQRIENMSGAPAAEINQHVLAKNRVHRQCRQAVDMQQIGGRETHALLQCRAHAPPLSSLSS